MVVLHWPKLFEGMVSADGKRARNGWGYGWRIGRVDGSGYGSGHGSGYGSGRGYGGGESK
jgi:hypothetical protein